jgi:hypothetical protein
VYNHNGYFSLAYAMLVAIFMILGAIGLFMGIRDELRITNNGELYVILGELRIKGFDAECGCAVEGDGRGMKKLFFQKVLKTMDGGTAKTTMRIYGRPMLSGRSRWTFQRQLGI